MTFEEVYKVLYKKYDIVRFDCIDKTIKAKDYITIDTFDLFDLINGLKETYAPKIKMTFEQKDGLMQFLDESDFGFKTFWICFGSCSSLYKEFSEKELMQAWLHPELIEVSND
ncbi:MAG: hypothetical protein GX453_00300 [Lactococcus chungangensis]|uniref:Uncharacterized protein n=1 Tax=Pseudolactococcus chungangensis TaxID=451457 RepID=A0A847J2V1_9LACT|nr:hypothetical protein [Lactococcus chungangensis]